MEIVENIENVEIVENVEGTNPPMKFDTDDDGQERLERKRATYPDRDTSHVDFVPYPKNIKLYIDDKVALWCKAVAYNDVDDKHSNVYHLFKVGSNWVEYGGLPFDKNALDERFERAKTATENAYKDGKTYDYKKWLPKGCFAPSKDPGLNGVYEIRNRKTGAIKSLAHNPWDEQAFYESMYVKKQIWAFKQMGFGYHLRNLPVTFSNDPNKACITLCLIDKYVNGQLFNEEQMLEKCKTPAWDEWLLRFDKEDQECILAWIWCVVRESKNDCEILYLRGEGGDGKSTMVRALVRGLCKTMIFGNWDNDTNISDDEIIKNNPLLAQSSGLTSDINGEHFVAGIYDKRILYIPDCKNTAIIKSSIIHQITGGDPLKANEKFEKAFVVCPRLCVLVCSNEFPTVDFLQNNELRRLLYVTTRPDWIPLNKKDPTFEDRLANEVDTLLYKCKFYYDKRTCSRDNYIQTINEKIARLEDSGIISQDNKYDMVFEKDPDGTVCMLEIKRTLDRVNSELRGRMAIDYDPRAIQSWFREKYGIRGMEKNLTKRYGGKTHKFYKGIKIRNADDIVDAVNGIEQTPKTCPHMDEVVFVTHQSECSDFDYGL